MGNVEAVYVSARSVNCRVATCCRQRCVNCQQSPPGTASNRGVGSSDRRSNARWNDKYIPVWCEMISVLRFEVGGDENYVIGPVDKLSDTPTRCTCLPSFLCPPGRRLPSRSKAAVTYGTSTSYRHDAEDHTGECAW